MYGCEKFMLTIVSKEIDMDVNNRTTMYSKVLITGCNKLRVISILIWVNGMLYISNLTCTHQISIVYSWYTKKSVIKPLVTESPF